MPFAKSGLSRWFRRYRKPYCSGSRVAILCRYPGQVIMRLPCFLKSSTMRLLPSARFLRLTIGKRYTDRESCCGEAGKPFAVAEECTPVRLSWRETKNEGED